MLKINICWSWDLGCISGPQITADDCLVKSTGAYAVSRTVALEHHISALSNLLNSSSVLHIVFHRRNLDAPQPSGSRDFGLGWLTFHKAQIFLRPNNHERIIRGSDSDSDSHSDGATESFRD
jgi:hypothetical protein